MTAPDSRGCLGHLLATRTLILLAGFCVMPAVRALDIYPSVQVGEVYTSNLLLAPDDEIHDFVTLIAPALAISHQSQRIDFNAEYTYSILRYSETDEGDSSFSDGVANLDLTVIPDTFHLESFAVRTQELIDPESSLFWTNVPIVDNRMDETRLETSPHLDTEVFGLGVDISYVLGRVNYDSQDIEDVTYQETHTAITGPEHNQGLSWGLFHDYAVYEYETPPDNKSQLAYLTLTYGFRESGDVFVFGSAGMENNYEDFSSGTLEDFYWEIGFRRISGRMLIEAAVGDRSYGSTMSGRIRREINEGSIELAYSEIPSVEEGLFEQRPVDPTIEPPQVPPYIQRPGVGNRFIYKLGTATLVKHFGRNQLGIILFSEETDNIIARCDTSAPDCTAPPSDETLQDSETQYGGSLELSRQLGQRTSVGLEGEFAKREFANENNDQVSAVRLVGNYALGQKLSLEGWLARYKQQGSNIASDNYEEFQVGMTLNYDFR